MTPWGSEEFDLDTSADAGTPRPEFPITHIPVEPVVVVLDDETKGRSGLDNALSSLDRIYRSLIVAADLMRENRLPEAERHFGHCRDGLDRFLETVRFIRLALQLDFETMAVDGIRLVRLEKEFCQILQAMGEGSSHADWEEVADRIEYEMLANLCSWRNALRAVRPA